MGFQIRTFFFLILFAFSAQAQEIHSKATLVHDPFSSNIRLGVDLEIEKGWHTYWQNPGDVGAPPELNITSPVSIQQSDLMYPIPNRIRSDPFDFYGYEDETLFYKTVTFPNTIEDSSVSLKVEFNWLICKVVCIPCTKIFHVTLPIHPVEKTSYSRFDSFAYPKENPRISSSLSFESDRTLLSFSSNSTSFHSADFFPTSEVNQIFNKPISKEIQGTSIQFTYPKTKFKNPVIHGLLKLDSKTAYWINSNQEVSAPKPTFSALHLLQVLFFAFLGGLLLNLMPCVLPVVSLKVLSTLKSNQEKKSRIRQSNLMYGLGICVSLLTLAIIFLLFRNTSEGLGWGFQLQSPTFITFLIFLFFLIGLNLIGYFEVPNISIPGLGKIFQSNSLGSDFLGGFFVTLVATPCTAPFMAAAIGYALSQDAAIVILTFLFLALGLSSPYLVLAFAPSLAKFFPRPGEWMIKLKEILSFPMFLTVVWLVWVLNQLTHEKAVLFILAAIVFVIFFFWSKQKLFSKKSTAKNLVLFFSLLCVIILGTYPLMPEKRDGLEWEAFDGAQISTYENSWTFVDFTADWCITCKANERLTLSNSSVLQAFRDHNVRMVKADWTRRNPEITSVLQQYGRIGVPFYLLYKPGLTTPIVLPTLLTPTIVIEALSSKGE